MIDEIKKSKELLASLNESREDLKHIQDELLEDPKVQEYVAASNLLCEVDAKIKKLNQDIIEGVQENCQHPAWVLLNKDEDHYEGRVYFTCRCVACGKEQTDNARFFPADRIIFSGLSMGMNAKWNEFSEKYLDDGFSIEEKGKAFTKIYNLKRH